MTVTLTPRLCRAGRALLAWTQLDLANRAQTAVSTIADFERGARSPVAKSIDALEAALKDGGVRFEGNRAFLAACHGGFTQLDGGRPIPLITSADLTSWANRVDSSAVLPTLISMLIHASAGADAILRFPADEGVRESGWDGTCESPRSTEYVPEGSSRWELSVNKKSQTKANSDFSKRAAEGDVTTRALTTYVVVALRAWTNKDLWVAERRKSGIFKDVRAYDVHDLIQWLGMHAQVAHWLAVRLNKRSVSGVMSLDEAWRRWALATAPPLTESIILAGRDREAADVLAWLKAPRSVLRVQAAEAEEAVAFLFAVIQQLPKAYRETYRTHTLVAESDSAVREISVAMKPQIIVMSGASPGFAESIAEAGHHVYALCGAETQVRDGVLLTEVRRVDLADALEKTGKSPENARSLASRADGSVAMLRRILSQTATAPNWMDNVSRNTVVAAFFAGAWDEEAPADQAIIAALAKRSFDEVSRELAGLTIGVGAPLRRSITKVGVISIQYLWSIVAPRLTDADVTAYLDIARGVLLQVDPRFYEANRSRVIAFGARPPIETKELRRGLLETLNVMAAAAEFAQKSVPFLEERIRGFVRQVLEDADAARWWSLRDVLPLLAESAPEEFLDAVEASVTHHDVPIAVLLQSDGEGFLARDYISDLTTALERLAWFPEYFASATISLAALAAKDRKGSRHGNRPANTLRQIFLLWNPQTLASSDERLVALNRVREYYSDVAWDLMISLLPKYGGDSSSFSSKPVWLRLPAGDISNTKPAERATEAAIIFDWLVSEAAQSVARWSKLLESLTGLGEASQRRATEGFLALVRTLDHDDDRLAARDIARKVLHRHREFGTTAGWAMQESVLKPLQEAFDLLTPADIVDREGWVFANQPAPPDPVPGHNLETREAHNAAHRHRVARDLIASGSIDEIFAMATAVENPVQLGIALVDVDVDAPLRDALIARGVQSARDGLRRLSLGMVDAGVAKCGAAWAESIVRAGDTAGWSSAALAIVLQGMPRENATFDLAREVRVEAERIYWETTPWTWFIHSNLSAITCAVEAKLRFGQSIDATELIGQTGPYKFPSELLLQSLRAASSQITAQCRQTDTMLSHYCGLILDHLIADETIARDTLIGLEWIYFGLFQASERSSALLEAGLARDPEFFVNVVSLAYRTDSDDDTIGSEEKTAQKVAVAEQSFTLLDKWSIVPGSNSDGTIDAAALYEWVQKARALAISARRTDIIDQQIGMILSAAKAEPDGAWPPKPVREVLESVRSKHLGIGFQVGTRNRRGVTTRGPLDGGELERNLKCHYELLAERFRGGFPRTATALRAIASSYKIDALYMDQLADAVDRA